MSSITCIKTTEVSLDSSNEAIRRINKKISWTDEDQEIIDYLSINPDMGFVAVLDRKIVGYAVLRESDKKKALHVSWIATDAIKKGVGSALMHAVVLESVGLGNRYITLYHKKDSKKLKYFYKKIARTEDLGYIREENEKYDDCRVTYIIKP